MKTTFLLLLCCFVLAAYGQNDSSRAAKKVRFTSLNHVGLLEGEKGSAFQVQTINGFAHRGWAAGIGLGLDYYRFRGLPLFFDLRKSLLKETSPLFVYADAGVHFPWMRGDEANTWLQTEHKNGLYLDAGVQYLWRLSEDQAVSFSIGYSEKKVTEVTRQYVPCLVPPCAEKTQQFDHRLKRISLKAGFRL